MSEPAAVPEENSSPPVAPFVDAVAEEEPAAVPEESSPPPVAPVVDVAEEEEVQQPEPVVDVAEEEEVGKPTTDPENEHEKEADDPVVPAPEATDGQIQLKPKTVRGKSYLASPDALYEIEEDGSAGPKAADLVRSEGGKKVIAWLNL